MKFAIFDAANLFARAHYVCSGDPFTKSALSLQIVFNSLRKAYRDFGCDHIVVVGEGRSWRYEIYPQYKANRVLKRAALTPKEQEEQAVQREVTNDLLEFLENRTRMTVLRSKNCEGDDYIAHWIALHPQHEHVIISSDSDMLQLLSPNVTIYDGINERTITMDGVFDLEGQPLVFYIDTSSTKIKVKGTIEEERKKFVQANKEALRAAKRDLKEAEAALAKAGDAQHASLLQKAVTKAQLKVLAAESKMNEEFAWEPEADFHRKALFMKIIRGDAGDGIFSANPGVRYKGSKNNVGIEDAWNDRHEKGFAWNNFFLKSWDKLMEGDNGEPVKKEVKVLDEYAMNETLIDLTKQPPHIITEMNQTVLDAIQKPPVSSLGIYFARFCNKYELRRVAQDTDHLKYLGAGYGVNV